MTSLKDIDVKRAGVLRWPRHITTPSEVIQSIRNKTKLSLIRSPIYSRLVLQFVGTWSYLLAHVLNKTHVFNIETFNNELSRIEAQQIADNDPHQREEIRLQENDGLQSRKSSSHRASPLLTLSNHISCIDDPILWGSLLPLNYYSTNTNSVRWTAAAVEICFSKPWHSALFSLGKTFPIVRGAGLDQPAMEFASALLNYNQWLHLFPEGRVMRDDKQQVMSNKERGYTFKWGAAKLILNYFRSTNRENKLIDSDRNSKSMRILPFYHLGLDKILPIGRPYVPKFGKHITIYIRPKVIEMNARLLNEVLTERQLNATMCKSRSNDEILRIKLTNYLEEEMEKLIEPTTRLHEQIS